MATRSAPRAANTRERDQADGAPRHHPATSPEPPPRRAGRPPLGDAPRQLVAVRIDRHVIAGLKAEAKRLGIGYHTLINKVLARSVNRRQWRRGDEKRS